MRGSRPIAGLRACIAPRMANAMIVISKKRTKTKAITSICSKASLVTMKVVAQKVTVARSASSGRKAVLEVGRDSIESVRVVTMVDESLAAAGEARAPSYH